jgi:hypothetical protein
MSRSSSIKTGSTAALKESITQSYLELQRLRQLVREAEISRTARHGVKRGSRINPQRRRQPGFSDSRQWPPSGARAYTAGAFAMGFKKKPK